jgi:MtN3 and saliva related transmembrane protein
MTKEVLGTVIGSLAGAFTTIAYFPQLLHVWQRKSARDVSFRMFSIMCVGVTFWMIYGIMFHSWPMILANGITLLLSLMILALKVHYDGLDAARHAEIEKQRKATR